MVVRHAEIEDAGAIAAVHVRSWKAAYRGLVPDAWFAERTLRRRTAAWHEILGDDEGPRALVAEIDRRVVGFCATAMPSRDEDADERTAEIAALYVEPAHWRVGVGHALMSTVLSDLSGRVWHDLTLWVFEANVRARSFYARMGFDLDGGQVERPDEPPEVRLRRTLRPG